MKAPKLKTTNTWLTGSSKNNHFLHRLLFKPTSTGEDEQRREYILNIILVGSIITLLFLDVVVLYYTIRLGTNDHGISFANFSIIPAFFIFLFVLSRHQLFIPASYLLIAAYFLSVSYAVCRWTTDLPAALLGYALVIMLSSILIETRFGFLMTVVSGVTIILVNYFQTHGLIASDASWKQNPSVTDTLVFAILFLLIMSIAWLSNREIEKSLSRARKSERELQHERDFLEIKVEERTQELRKTQFEKIEQVNQFAKFGQLASGLFHDMLNITNALSVKIDLQTEHVDPKLVTTEPSSETASAITKQIEQFMRAIRKQLNRQESNELFSLVEGIEQVIQLLSYKAHREKVRIAFSREETTNIRHFGNPFKFHQIIFNLILNGIESHETITHESGRERSVTVRAERRNCTAIIHIEDRGCGINPSIRAKIFNPFFSTKSESRGMGIGLASVKKLIEEDFGGNVIVQNNVDNGSIFTITFPLR